MPPHHPSHCEPGYITPLPVFLPVCLPRSLPPVPVQVDDTGRHSGQIAGGRDQASLQRLGVELGDADAEPVALRGALHRPPEHLQRLHLLGHLQRRDLHRLQATGQDTAIRGQGHTVGGINGRGLLQSLHPPFGPR